MRLGQYGRLVGLSAREAGFDAVENEVEAESVRLLADQDVNELSRRGGDKRICVWREAEHAWCAPLWQRPACLRAERRRRGRTCRRIAAGTSGRLTRAELGVLDVPSPASVNA